MSKTPRILFILPYPIGYAPSQRFRVEAFFPLLLKNGYSFDTHCFLSPSAWNILYKKGSYFQKAGAVVKGFAGRLFVLFFKAWKYDYIFIHREATPLGPPIVEWILAKLFRKKYILDFDDAIWIPNTSRENRIVAWIKACWKVKYSCGWAYKVVGGNDYLCSYARNYNKNVIKIPTSVDTSSRHNSLRKHHSGKLTVGWTGSHSTMHYLGEIIPMIAKLQQEYDFTFLVISNKDPKLNLKDWEFVPWREKTEIEDLLRIDIGVMPLKPDAWSEGKCGFKLIQYLALGIPAIASPIGVNSLIVEEGVSGYLCSTELEWLKAFKRLLSDVNHRQAMGRVGRKKIVNEYSLSAQDERFLQLFN